MFIPEQLTTHLLATRWSGCVDPNSTLEVVANDYYRRVFVTTACRITTTISVSAGLAIISGGDPPVLVDLEISAKRSLYRVAQSDECARVTGEILGFTPR